MPIPRTPAPEPTPGNNYLGDFMRDEREAYEGAGRFARRLVPRNDVDLSRPPDEMIDGAEAVIQAALTLAQEEGIAGKEGTGLESNIRPPNLKGGGRPREIGVIPDPEQAAARQGFENAPGPVQYAVAAPVIAYNMVEGAYTAFNEAVELLKGGASPSDPEVVKRAAEIAGVAMSGSMFGSAPRGALRAGVPRVEPGTPPPGRMLDPAGYYSHASDIAASLPPKAPARDMFGQLANQGVTEREIRALGLDEFLLHPEHAAARREAIDWRDRLTATDSRISELNRKIKEEREVLSRDNPREPDATSQELMVNQRELNRLEALRTNQAEHAAATARQAKAVERAVYQDGPGRTVTRDELRQRIEQERPQLEASVYRLAQPHPGLLKLEGDEFVNVLLQQGLSRSDALTVQTHILGELPNVYAGIQRGVESISQNTHDRARLRAATSRAIQETTGTPASRLIPNTDRIARYTNYALDPRNPTYSETRIFAPDRDSISRFRELQSETDRLRAEVSAIFRGEQSGSGQSARVNTINSRLGDIANEQSALSSRSFNDDHFSEPNVISHVMASAQRLPDGSVTYVPSQIQSSWAARGSDVGMRRPTRRAAAEDAEYQKLTKELGLSSWEQMVLNDYPLDAATRIIQNQGHLDPSQVQVRDPIRMGRWQELRQNQRLDVNRVPYHDLTQSIDAWLEPTLRRVVQDAVANGATSISIPSGRTLAQYNPDIKPDVSKLYDDIIPRKLRAILREMDRSPENREAVSRPTRTDRLHTIDDSYHADIRRYDNKVVDSEQGFHGEWTTFPLSRKIIQEQRPGTGVRLMVGGTPMDDGGESLGP